MIEIQSEFCFGFTTTSISGGYSWTLVSALGSLLIEAEARYGKRDMEWTILGVEIGLDRESPAVWYPGNVKNVSVILSKHCRYDWRLACHQLAHEVVHLLAPNGEGSANNFEEGFATLFADEMSLKNNWGIQTIEPYYCLARTYIESLLKIDPNAVKKIREQVPYSRDLTPETIKQIVTNCPQQLATDLCRVGY